MIYGVWSILGPKGVGSIPTTSFTEDAWCKWSILGFWDFKINQCQYWKRVNSKYWR